VCVRQDLAFIKVVHQRPLQYAHWRQDRIVQQFVYDINTNARLLGPILHDTADNLATGGFGAGPDGEETVFATLDVREDVGEGLGAQEADGSNVSVSGRDEDIGKALFDGQILNRVDTGFNIGVGAFFDEVGKIFSDTGVRGF